MKNNLDTPVAKQCRALYTKYAYGHTYGLLKVGLRHKEERGVLMTVLKVKMTISFF